MHPLWKKALRYCVPPGSILGAFYSPMTILHMPRTLFIGYWIILFFCLALYYALINVLPTGLHRGLTRGFDAKFSPRG